MARSTSVCCLYARWQLRAVYGWLVTAQGVEIGPANAHHALVARREGALEGTAAVLPGFEDLGPVTLWSQVAQ